MIKKEYDIFGFLFLGDCADIYIIPLLNILVSGGGFTVAVLELVGFQGHLADGVEKYGTFICNRFLEHIIIDPPKSITYVVMFYGAANV